jgi:hypothetical protein
MKNNRSFRFITALFLMLMTGLMVQAQNAPSQEAQKKEKAEQEIKMKEMEMQLKKQHLEQEQKMVEVERKYARQLERTSERDKERAIVYSRSSGINDEGSYFIQSYGQENQSQLTLRNSFSGETLSSDGEFEVDENTSKIRFTVNGKVRHGEINIKVLYPGGKVFKDLNINSSAQITFSQSLTIKEEEKKKYVGVWKYEVNTKTAEGSYMMSIQTH